MKFKVLYNCDNGKLLFNNDFFEYLSNNLIQDLEWDCRYLVTITTYNGLPLTKSNVSYTSIKFVTSYFDFLINKPGRNLYWLIDNLHWIIDWLLLFSTDSKFKLDEDDVVNIVVLKRILESKIRSSDMVKYRGANSQYLKLFLVFIRI